MVPNTSELLPDPETPVNTVNRRFGISTLTSLRLFWRAPCTRITSWLSATLAMGDGAFVFVALLTVSLYGEAASTRPGCVAGPDQAWAMRTRLPEGSRNAQSRAPQGWEAGSWSTSAPDARTFSNVVSRSSERKIAACSDP
jgi:hypothetical protein